MLCQGCQTNWLTIPFRKTLCLLGKNHFNTKEDMNHLAHTKIKSSVCSVTQSGLTLCDPTDHRPPGSSVHWIFQARILEWVVMPSSRGSSWPGDWTCISCVAGGFFTTESPGKPTVLYIKKQSIFNLLTKISQRWQRLTILNIQRGHSVFFFLIILNLNRKVTEF